MRATSPFERQLDEAIRPALASLVRSQHALTIGQLAVLLEGEHGEVLGELTIAELEAASRASFMVAWDGGPSIDMAMRRAAMRARGEEFLSHMRHVFHSAPGPINASYLRARLGGPRWKLQTAVRKLEELGEVSRRGKTYGTVYVCQTPRESAEDT